MQSTAPTCSRGSCSQWKHCKKITEAKPLLGNRSTAPSIPGTPWYPKLGGKKSKEELRQQHVTAYSQHLRCCKIPAKNGTGLGKQGGFSCWALTYRPKPATQCTATQQPGSSQNLVLSKLSQSSTILLGGGAPSSNGQSWGNGGRMGKEKSTVRSPRGKPEGIAFIPGGCCVLGTELRVQPAGDRSGFGVLQRCFGSGFCGWMVLGSGSSI